MIQAGFAGFDRVHTWTFCVGETATSLCMMVIQLDDALVITRVLFQPA